MCGSVTFDAKEHIIMNFDRKLAGTDRRLISPKGLLIKLLNKYYRRSGLELMLTSVMHQGQIMVAFEQQINFYHLFNEIIHKQVPGEVVELGCFEGQTAVLFRKLMNKAGTSMKLMLYDNFQHTLGFSNQNIRDRLIGNFRKENLLLPEIIEGDFYETLPSKLPANIAFLHIDTGYGGDRIQHKEVILHCLKSAYDRMSNGAVCLLMDYHDPLLTLEGSDSNPGVKMACDEFFKDKPEEVFTLYGGPYSHGYFIKGFRLPS
jgi:O-methyltransferase